MNSNIVFRLLTDMRKNHISSILKELSMVEFTTLHVLKRWHFMNPEKEITVSDLANYTDSSLPAVSRTLKQLEVAELIKREISEKDRRAISVLLTEKGESILTNEETRLKKFSERLCDTLGTEEMERFATFLAEFQKATDEVLLEMKKEN